MAGEKNEKSTSIYHAMDYNIMAKEAIFFKWVNSRKRHSLFEFGLTDRI